ncbi:uncharacterized protein PAC_18096 [Phialocephala subalpina]|uniref:Uncharacterized protein n=1 Tax=Phialocephala subalpina TaxID=576137 RepID=A0A1L7XT89_9HELO|nr:uncharacterized protein PAC_18096 [Phialocephala subalpina]
MASTAAVFITPCMACAINNEPCLLSPRFPSCVRCQKVGLFCMKTPLYDWDKRYTVHHPGGGRNEPGAYRDSPYSDPVVYSRILASALPMPSTANISAPPRVLPSTRPQLSTHANFDLPPPNTLLQGSHEQSSQSFTMPKGRTKEVNLDRTSDTTPQSTFAKVTACERCLREGKTCVPPSDKNLERLGQCINCQKVGKNLVCSRTERGSERCVLCEKKGHACVEGTRKQGDAIWIDAKKIAERDNTTPEEEFFKIEFNPTLRLTYDIEGNETNPLTSSPMAPRPNNKKRKLNTGEASTSTPNSYASNAARHQAQLQSLPGMNQDSDATITEHTTPGSSKPMDPDWLDWLESLAGGPTAEYTSTLPPPEEWYKEPDGHYHGHIYGPPEPQGPYDGPSLPGNPGFKWNNWTKKFDRVADELVGYEWNQEKKKFIKVADEVPGYVYNKKTKYFEPIEEDTPMVIDPPESSAADPSYQDKGKGKERSVEEEATPAGGYLDDYYMPGTYSFTIPELPKLLCCNNVQKDPNCKIETEGGRLLLHIFTTGTNSAVGEHYIPHPSTEWSENPLYIGVTEDFEPFGGVFSHDTYNLNIYSVQDLRQGLLVQVTPTGSRGLDSKPRLLTYKDAGRTPDEKLVILSGVVDLVCEEHKRAWNVKFLRYLPEGARYKKGNDDEWIDAQK